MITPPKKILIIRQGAIGDVVHTFEIFKSLKRLNKNIEIHYLTGKIPAQLLENEKDIDKVMLIEEKSYKYIFGLAKELKKEKYDLIINLQPSLRFKTLCFLASAKKTAVYKKTFKEHAVLNFFNTAKKVAKELEIAREIEISIPTELTEKMKRLLNRKTPIIAINTQAGPNRDGRKYPMAHFESVIKGLIQKYDPQIFVIGAKEDYEKVKHLEKLGENIKITAGKLSILETAGLLSLCDIVISGDTGPLHIAAATKKPTCIGLFGAMPAARTGPYGERHVVLRSAMECVPCNKRRCRLQKGSEYSPCLENIAPERVMEAIEKILGDCNN